MRMEGGRRGWQELPAIFARVHLYYLGQTDRSGSRGKNTAACFSSTRCSYLTFETHSAGWARAKPMEPDTYIWCAEICPSLMYHERYDRTVSNMHMLFCCNESLKITSSLLNSVARVKFTSVTKSKRVNGNSRLRLRGATDISPIQGGGRGKH